MTDYTKLVSIGDKFGMLTVIGELPKRHFKSGAKRMWLCECECGRTKAIQENNLKSGKSRSCGCARIGSHLGFRKENARHRERLYRIWVCMRHRCRSGNGKNAKWYKNVGIRVCDEWEDYEVFKEWALRTGYNEKANFGECTIDRINPFGNYEPSNCRWATVKEQNNNTRKQYERRMAADGTV